jgi:hypothetical protein
MTKNTASIVEVETNKLKFCELDFQHAVNNLKISQWVHFLYLQGHDVGKNIGAKILKETCDTRRYLKQTYHDSKIVQWLKLRQTESSFTSLTSNMP